MLDTLKKELLRKLPSMDEMLAAEWVASMEALLGRETIKNTIAQIIEKVRRQILDGTLQSFSVEDLVNQSQDLCHKRSSRHLISLINATGVIVHTNLGRSLLHPEAVDAVCAVTSQYSSLEYDVALGERGHRHHHVEWLLQELSGAEAALAVNNNAGAVLLSLAALGNHKETLVSRGELVEIGGSFRIPEIMALSGTTMVEVGTTNRTHLQDYSQGVKENTAILLKVHPSNFRVVGFSSEVTREELSGLAREKGLIFIEDLGSGTLVDLSPYCKTYEPTVASCVQKGVDVVTFSGDKLLGGPQAGIIVGKAVYVEKIRSHPLYRALRLDKMTLAALEETLRLYLKGKEKEIPTLVMITEDTSSLEHKASVLKQKIDSQIAYISTQIVSTKDAIGGGAFPETFLPGFGVLLRYPGVAPALLHKRLRSASNPVVAIVKEDSLVFHVRTLQESEYEKIVASLKESVEK